MVQPEETGQPQVNKPDIVKEFIKSGFPSDQFSLNRINSTVGDHSEFNNLVRHQVISHFFRENLASANGSAKGSDIVSFLKNECGFQMDDQRLTFVYDSLFLNSDRNQFKEEISVDEFISIVTKSGHSILLDKSFKRELAIPEFESFANGLVGIFDQVKSSVSEKSGLPAQSIPQLENVDPSLFGFSICTIDGQRFDYGDSKVNFSVQSCCKPLTYCLALKENGEKKVHSHIGREPSVSSQNLELGSNNLPHNPMTNGGGIISCSLINPGLPLYKRFDHIQNQFSKLSGGSPWGFSYSVYLGEKATADQSFCLAYLMRSKNVFPEKTDIIETLDFYFQCCSLEADCNKLAVAGATIANGGVCPLTGEMIFSKETCRNCLSLMYSNGLYDYSAEWAFSIGIPAKSGVSGCIYVIIPGFGSICTYAPPLDKSGNSVRGIEFFKKLVSIYSLHAFHIEAPSSPNNDLINPRKPKKMNDRESKVAALYASAEGDLIELRRLILSGVSPKTTNYDKRTLLHLAASEGHIHIVKFLVNCGADPNAIDRWGGSPFTDAEKYNHSEVVKFLVEKNQS